jgi:hypothetical protein
MPTTRQETLPIDRETFHRVRTTLIEAYQHDVVEAPEGHHLFIRLPTDEPDPVSDLERALEEVPAWLEGRLASVFLLGNRRSVHVPGYSANPILAERNRIDAVQASELRTRLREAFDSLIYRSTGDGLNLLRLGIRLPKPQVAQLDENDLNGLAFSVGHLLDSGAHKDIPSVLIVADEDHLRLRGRDVFADLLPRWKGARTRPDRKRAIPRHDQAPPAPMIAQGGFPVPQAYVRPVAAPRRHVEEVEPLIEIEEEIEATHDLPMAAPTETRVLPAIDQRRLELGAQLSAKLLKLAGFKVLENVYHGASRYAAAAERATGTPRRVAVKTYESLSRRDLDQLLLESRAMTADLVLAITSDPRSDLVARAEGTRVRILRPEDVARLSFT